jgi:hypothetical protein
MELAVLVVVMKQRAGLSTECTINRAKTRRFKKKPSQDWSCFLQVGHEVHVNFWENNFHCHAILHRADIGKEELIADSNICCHIIHLLLLGGKLLVLVQCILDSKQGPGNNCFDIV